MTAIVHERCFNHGGREAAARCPECRRSFCRECVIEHEDRVLCITCLRQAAGSSREGTRRMARFWNVAFALLGLLTAWFFFFLVGEWLSKSPNSFHRDEIWNAPSIRIE